MSPPSERGVGPTAWCLIAALLFGASTPAAKLLLPGIGPVLLAGLLYLGAAAAVAPWAIPAWRRHHAAGATNDLRLAVAVLLGGIVGPVLLLFGLRVAGAGSVSLWLTLEIVATALVARILFHEHLGLRGSLAVALVLAGAGALAGGGGESWSAAVLVALAALAWGIDNALTSTLDGYSTAQITFAKGLAASLFALPAGLLLAGRPELAQVGASLVVGALGYGVSLVLYVAGAQQLGAMRSQLWFSTAPLFGLLTAWVLLGERLTAAHAIAVACMAVGLWLLRGERHAHEHRHDAEEHTHWHRHDDGHHDHVHDGAVGAASWHQHPHTHDELRHAHDHRPDVHHRHGH